MVESEEEAIFARPTSHDDARSRSDFRRIYEKVSQYTLIERKLGTDYSRIVTYTPERGRPRRSNSRTSLGDKFLIYLPFKLDVSNHVAGTPQNTSNVRTVSIHSSSD